jgi:hypothetical protein
MRRSLFAIIVTLGLAGCAAGGNMPPRDEPDPRKFAQLVPGQSTTADAIKILGTPNSYSSLVKGQVLLQWIDVYHSPAIHVAILFGPDGRLVKVQHLFTQ